MNKTNAMRHLDKEGVSYDVHEYSPSSGIDARSVAATLHEDIRRVYKTLVTRGRSQTLYVFVLPATSELDLKKAARCAKEKNMEMLPQKELLGRTGYVHGGCSPIGMKKPLKTFLDESAKEHETIFISGGKIGFQIEIRPMDLVEISGAEFADIKEENQ